MAEQRLIDAEALLIKLSRMIDYCKKDSKVNGLTALFQVGDAIMDCPTIEAKPIVHCKDCYCFSYMGSVNKYYCDCYGGYVTDEDYCSRPTPKNSNCGAQMDEKENDNAP